MSGPEPREKTRYPIPATTRTVEEVRQRSRFITTVGTAGTIDEAREFVARVSAGHPDATHNCWAYVVGPPGDTSRVGASDDGEPHGTAGRPMLAVLLGSGVGDIAAVVTRYYGGTKLGKGGLVRAYAGGVKLALDGLPLGERVRRTALLVEIPYSSVAALKHLLPGFEAEILDESYGTQATFTIRLPEERSREFTGAVEGLTGGRARIEAVGPGTAVPPTGSTLP